MNDTVVRVFFVLFIDYLHLAPPLSKRRMVIDFDKNECDEHIFETRPEMVFCLQRFLVWSEHNIHNGHAIKRTYFDD